ncbi:MAG: hypothetical protein JWO86_6092 [Myxococcaceae bacterium]|nr:hypothetical protein [Myxococcaceae bacterium]
MRLVSVRLRNVGVFEDTTVSLADGATARAEARTGADDAAVEDEAPEVLAPRPVTVLFGADGIGKTTLLTALAVTRPGYALPPSPYPRPTSSLPGAGGSASGAASGVDAPASVVTEWLLGEDDPERPHPLVVASPSAVLDGESTETAGIRRREQALFDRRAQGDGGFVFVGFSGARWFSRAANMLSVPERSVLRYDVRHAASFDDPTRADLTRETKQVLAYAGIARALGAQRAEYTHLERFDAAVREVVDVMLAPFGFTYAGVSPLSLEPEATDGAGHVVAFDALPRAARHLVAFGALSLRALFAAYPHSDDPREGEGVVAIDDVDAQQDPSMLRALIPLLRSALPNVQWILTTSSAQLAMACAPGEVIALRRTDTSRIEANEAVLH